MAKRPKALTFAPCFLGDELIPIGSTAFNPQNPLSKLSSFRGLDQRGELSHTKFALKLGVSKSLAHKLETSDEGGTLDTVDKIACALGGSVEELLGEEALRKKRSRRG